MAVSKGYVVIRKDECKGCQLCINSCPSSVLNLSTNMNRMGYHYTEYVGEGCTGCGICFYTCPEPAGITVFKKWSEITETAFCEVCQSESKVFPNKVNPEIKYCTVCLNTVKRG